MSGSNLPEPLVTVSVFLFGKPSWEVEGLEGSEVTPQLLDEVASCGREIDRRLGRAAELGAKLLGRGWEGLGLVYEIDFYKAVSLRAAEEELKALGVEPGEVSVREEVRGSETGSESAHPGFE
jgi:hypothetical protein